MARVETQLLPEFGAELEEIRKNGISKELLQKIIEKHIGNSTYNKELYNRYRAMANGVPIFNRQTRFEEEENPINNKVNNDFFGEIVNFKTGYFAGKPISYSYSTTEEAEETTGNEKAVDEAVKTVTDFVTRNNMFGVDMETTKFASIYGYCGRLFYVDKDGNERVMPVHGYETIILSETSICEPECAVRYYKTADINGVETWTVDFYDNKYMHTYQGTSLYDLTEREVKEHLFDYCPLQGILNNSEALGDAEKVLALIDDYDKVLSDNSNEVEAFVHAYMIFEGLRIEDEEIRKGQKSGSFVIPATGTQQGRAYFLTKNINDAFTEHHLQRTEDNIYRFSETPNLNDDTFGSASGISLKFKLHGLETKCGMFQAQMMNAAQYMWKLLASAWEKKGVKVDPLQVTMEFKRNFPLDTLSEAQTVQALIAAGIPKQIAYAQLSFVDDVDYVMQLIEEEKEAMPSLIDDEPDRQARLYKYQINMIQEYSEKIRSGEITEEKAIKMLKASVSIPESELRDLLDLSPEKIEEEAAEIVTDTDKKKPTL